MIFTSDIDLSKKSKEEVEHFIRNRDKLSVEEREYLQALPYCYEFYLSGRLVRFFHATPENIDGVIGNIDTIDRLYKLFLPNKNTISQEKSNITVYGHIHIPYIQKIYNRIIINTGSVGNAIEIFRNKEKDGNKKTILVNYAIITGEYNSRNIEETISYEIINVPYNIEKELQNSTDNFEFASYEQEIRK